MSILDLVTGFLVFFLNFMDLKTGKL
jgi:hypothetical protein